jgi:uncharacterized tellurite resistance protein B-like protein
MEGILVFKSLRELFNSDVNKSEPSDNDLKLAAATLMFELISADGRVDRVELVYMGEILRREFELDQEQLDELFELAKESANEATSLHGFTREICDNWGNPKRMKLLEYLWTLALSDETVDPHERHLVRKVAGLLYLNDNEIVIARENAKTQLGLKDL